MYISFSVCFAYIFIFYRLFSTTSSAEIPSCRTSRRFSCSIELLGWPFLGSTYSINQKNIYFYY